MIFFYMLFRDYVITSPSFQWVSLYLFIFELGGLGRLGEIVRNLGYKDEAVFLTNLSPLVSAEVRYLYEKESERLKQNVNCLPDCYILCGPIYDNANKLRIPNGTCENLTNLYSETWDINYTVPSQIHLVPPRHDDTVMPMSYIYTSYSMTAVAWFTIICLAIWTFVNRKHPVIKYAQPFFLYIILLGCFTGFSVNICLNLIWIRVADSEAYILRRDGIENGQLNLQGQNSWADTSCQSLSWLIVSSYALTFPVLMAKIWRLHQIVIATRGKGLKQVRKVSVSEIFSYIGIFLFFSYIILALWHIRSPLTYKIFVTVYDEFSNPVKSSGYCYFDNAGTPYFVILIFFVIAGLIVGSFVCFISRNDETQNNEVTYVALSMFNYLQVAVIGGMMIVILKDLSVYRYIVSVAAVFLAYGGIICLIFVPKILAVAFYDEEAMQFTISYDGKGITTNVNTTTARTQIVKQQHGGKMKGLKSDGVISDWRKSLKDVSSIHSFRDARKVSTEGMQLSMIRS